MVFLQIPLPKINSNHAAQTKWFSYKQATSLVDRMIQGMASVIIYIYVYYSVYFFNKYYKLVYISYNIMTMGVDVHFHCYKTLFFNYLVRTHHNYFNV